MTGKPIIYSGPMVRALLEGRKTMDRRVLKNVPPQPETNCHPSHQQKHPAPYLDAYCSKRTSAMTRALWIAAGALVLACLWLATGPAEHPCPNGMPICKERR